VGEAKGGRMESAVAMIKIDEYEYTLEDIRKWADGARGELEANPYEVVSALSELLIKSAHPAFLHFMAVCTQMGYGKIKELSIQDGLPVRVVYDIRTELDAVIEKSVKLV
jgi:hypothetical protein